MGKTTGISYVDASWNPWQGCVKVSEGCRNCYMYREMTQYGLEPTHIHRSSNKTFNAPLSWKEPKRILVCSWSDFWLNEANDWRDEAIKIMKQCPQHTFMITTKRPGIMWSYANSRYGNLGDNVWLGVSVEDQGATYRIPDLLATKAAHRWLSIEPLIAPVQLPDSIKGKVDLVVIGCESGANRRQCDIEWIYDIVDHCTAMDIPLFVKQINMGGRVFKHEEDFPEWLRRRDLP